MELEHLPIIDWDLGIKLAGNQQPLAHDLLGLLVNSLPQEVFTIKDLHAKKNYPELTKQVHKLRGAVAYCGLPRLKTLLSLLETELKNHIMFSLPPLIDQLDVEVTLLLLHYPRPPL